MKRLFLFSLFCCWFLFGNSQNLVRNPGMDTSINCPNGLGDIINCENWSSTTVGTPDYFHLCNNGLAPINYFGTQFPFSDSGYIGLGTFVYYQPNMREYVTGRLIAPLINGKKYCLSFYISLSDSSNAATSHFGVYLSANNPTLLTDSLLNPFFKNLPYSPQFEYNQIISDTVNWLYIEDTIIASGGETYLTFGNFRPDSLTTWDTVQTIRPQSGIVAYYYIDQVSLILCEDTAIQLPTPEPISAITVPNIFTPNGDNINDDFRILTENLADYSLEIYNRWGVQVFSTSYTGQFWDGRTTSGAECSDGTYYYIIRATGADSKPYSLKGFVTLIR